MDSVFLSFIFFRISFKFYRMSCTCPQSENQSASNVTMVVSGGADRLEQEAMTRFHSVP